MIHTPKIETVNCLQDEQVRYELIDPSDTMRIKTDTISAKNWLFSLTNLAKAEVTVQRCPADKNFTKFSNVLFFRTLLGDRFYQLTKSRL